MSEVVVRTYRVFYTNELGKEHDLGRFISEPLDPEGLRSDIQSFVTRNHGEEVARKWVFFGCEYEEV